MATAGRLILTQGTEPATPPTGKSVLYCKDDGLFYHKTSDGVEHTLSQPDSGITMSYQSTDKPTANAEVSILLPYAITFLTDLAGSTYYSATAPSATVTVSIKCNGVEFGMLEVLTSNSATFTSTEISCVAGDRISFAFPEVQDSTWSGIAITLKGIR